MTIPNDENIFRGGYHQLATGNVGLFVSSLAELMTCCDVNRCSVLLLAISRHVSVCPVSFPMQPIPVSACIPLQLLGRIALLGYR